MGLLRYEYLGPEVLAGFDTYKYSCRDTSPLSNYVMHPFWNQCVKVLFAFFAGGLDYRVLVVEKWASDVQAQPGLLVVDLEADRPKQQQQQEAQSERKTID